MDPQRAELMQNAVQFLADPQVLSSFTHIFKAHMPFGQTRSTTLVQRIQFLESRGLTSEEITRAIVLANQSTIAAGQPSAVPYGYAGPATLQGPNPIHVPWDWRDYFVRYGVQKIYLWLI